MSYFLLMVRLSSNGQAYDVKPLHKVGCFALFSRFVLSSCIGTRLFPTIIICLSLCSWCAGIGTFSALTSCSAEQESNSRLINSRLITRREYLEYIDCMRINGKNQTMSSKNSGTKGVGKFLLD